MTQRQHSPTIFCKDREYYKQDWHDYYPAVVALVPAGSQVLDIGCGRGGLLEYLRQQRGCQVTGLDIADDAILACKEKGIQAIKCDVEQDDITGTFEVIILCAILEHLLDPVRVLTKLQANLADQGSLIVGVPNFSHILARIQYLQGKNVKVFGETESDYRLGIQPYDHVQFFNEATLLSVLKRTGYTPVDCSYYGSPFAVDPSASYWRRLVNRLARTMYGRINHSAFSHFIVVRAIKNQDFTGHYKTQSGYQL